MRLAFSLCTVTLLLLIVVFHSGIGMSDQLKIQWFEDTCDLGYPRRSTEEVIWNTAHTEEATGSI